MQITISKLVSLVIAAIYLVVAVLADGITIDLLPMLMVLAFVLAQIWFPEQLGSVTKSRRQRFGRHIDNESPAVMVAGFGWFFLVGMPLLILLLTAKRN